MGVIIAFIATNDDIGTFSNFAKYYIPSDGEIYGCNGSDSTCKTATCDQTQTWMIILIQK